MQAKEIYQVGVESQLKVWDAEIEHLQARADVVLANIEGRYYKVLRELRNKEQELRCDLQQLKVVDEASWTKVKTDLDKATDDMKAALLKAVGELDGD